MFRLLLVVFAAIALALLMHLMIAHASSGGLLTFAASMLAFFALRKLSHALESRL